MYHYDLCGLDYIYLANGYAESDSAYGPVVSFAAGLDDAIADEIVRGKPRLTGPEFRHVRTLLDLSQRNLASMMEISEQTVARWEKEQSALPFLADLFVRMLWRDAHGEHSPLAAEIERLWSLDESDWGKKVFRYAQGWKVAA